MMKRIALATICLLLPILLLSQSKKISINWDEDSQKTVVARGNQRQKANEVFDPYTSSALELNTERVMYHHQWRDSRPANPASARLTNITYANLSAAEREQINTELVPDQLVYTLKSSRGRGVLYTIFSISPVVRQNGMLRKVTSFNLTYDYRSSFNRSSAIVPVNSIFSSGQWFKFKVDRTGVYRIDRNFLNDLGLNPDGVDPRTIKIYGHGGKTLPFLNSENQDFDPPQLAIQVVGEADGSFDQDDFILFYGEGTEGYDAQNDTHRNPYADESFYYITAGGTSGQRIREMVEPSGAANLNITRFNDARFHEVDEISPAKVGRRWYGNRFDIENEQSYEFNFPNIVSGAPMDITIRVAAASETPTSMAVSINGASVDPLIFAPINDPKLLDDAVFNGSLPAAAETVKVDLTYNNAGNPASIGYLDYIRVVAERQLIAGDTQLGFRYNEAANNTGIGEYIISNAGGISQVWDVTNPSDITFKENTGGATQLSFKTSLGQIREYVAVNPSDYFEPQEVGQSAVANQDLKGRIFNDDSGNFKDIDYLIITAPFLIQPALKLATHHNNISGLNVKVVTTDRIYQEFSSGKQDITAIRNFIRYVYNNASSEDKRVKYVCLFGDASYDYKDRVPDNTNIVPVYHRLNSESTFFSYMSDEYYGMMDPEDGLMDLTDKTDIALGRILADNVSLANTMVNKVIDYSSKASYGNWRNNFVLVSDDADTPGEFFSLQQNLDNLGDEISEEKPFINVKKIHSDAYQQETSAGGDRYPDVNEAFSNAIEVGALLINYFGHGGEDGLAKEFIFTQEQAIELQNTNRYNCFVTVTCEFTKFDNPQRTTAGELTYWNPRGGAVALITTTRSISVSTGVDYNQELAPELFGFGTDDILPPAEALRVARNRINSGDKYVVFFIGDPATPLAFPEQEVRLTTLNGVPIGQATDTLKALSRVRLGGEVVDRSGNLLSDYNGVLAGKVYDKNAERRTLGNDDARDQDGNLLIMDFVTLGEILFNGQATVTGGKFEFEFVVPRDIRIPVGEGRVSFYAQRDVALEDQTGFNLDIKVGGLNENAPEDNEGPLIRLFMNDESFVNGGVTNDSPILIAKLEDENGINTASGIGHDMIAILDGDEANPIILNEYYQAEVDDFTKGTTTYRLRDLEKGMHTLTLKAWDVYNNSSTMDLQFVVAGSDELEITRVLNYPNPFTNYTEFWFNHNRPFEPLEVQVQVFTVTGKVVWTKNQIVTTDGFLSRDIVWDGRDDFGDRIGKGVYVYKITVKSTLTNQQIEKFEKLVIL